MPKIIGGSLAEHRAQTRRRVLVAFGELLDERGYDAVRLADIAERAGVGRTALYNHFADKEDILLAFAMDETERYVDEIRRALADADDPVEALRTFVRIPVSLAAEMHMGLAPHLSRALSPDALGRMREHVAVVEDLLGEVLRSGMDAGVFVREDVAETTALVLACLQTRTPSGELVERFVLRAVGAHPGAPDPTSG